MALSITMDIRGLARLGELAQLNLQEAVQMEAEEIVADAKSRCPVKTGALQTSLTYDLLSPYEAEIHDGVNYGHFVELGTSKQAAQPFLTPAMDAARERFGERVVKAIEQAAKDA